MRKHKPGLLVTLTLTVGLALVCALPFSISPSHARGEEENVALIADSSCPKCKGPMEAGFLLDHYEGSSAFGAEWAPFIAKNFPFSKQPKTKKITANRCTSCGFLELYAK